MNSLYGAELVTIEEAADILNVSTEYMFRLLVEKYIYYGRYKGSVYVILPDLYSYKNARDEVRRMGLVEVAHIAEDEGMYD